MGWLILKLKYKKYLYTFYCIIFLFISNNYAHESFLQYVLQKYSHTIYGKQCIFYPAKKPKRLLIFFSGARNNGQFYTLWSWFWEKNENWQETACLFLRDTDIS